MRARSTTTLVPAIACLDALMVDGAKVGPVGLAGASCLAAAAPRQNRGSVRTERAIPGPSRRAVVAARAGRSDLGAARRGWVFPDRLAARLAAA
jgi:hypothetical protein